MTVFTRVLIGLAFLAHWGLAQSVVRGPYLQVVTPTSVVVRWRTDVPTDSRVTYGPSAGAYSQQTILPETSTEHIVKLSNLQAATKYYYTIGTSTATLLSDTTLNVRTAPTVGSTAPIRIWALGDFGSNTPNQFAVRDRISQFTANRRPDVWLWLGDNAYSYGRDTEYQQNVFQAYPSFFRNIPVYPAPGNHDYADNVNNFDIAYYKIFSTPTQAEAGGVASGSASYYSVDYGNVHLVSLDSYGKEGGQFRLSDTTGTQVQWLKRDLAANRQPWTIVYFHHPPYTKGSHNSDTENELILLRQNLTPILERYKVDLVLNGHSHVYERSYRINGFRGNSETFDLATYAPNATTGRYDGSANSCPMIGQGLGTVYAVAGSGGQVGGQTPGYPHHAMTYSNSSTGGSLIIDVQDNRLDAQWVAADGTVPDRFTIMKLVNQRVEQAVNAGQPLTLTASWPGNYRWSSGETGRSISVSPPTSTTYTVQDAQGCLTDVFAVNVAQPTATNTQFDGQMTVYPNPTQGVANLHVSLPTATDLSLYVTDLQGKIVFEKDYPQTNLVDEPVSLPNAGEYWFVVKINGQVYARMSLRQ